MDSDRLLAIATRLFAELGYDLTSARMIADAAGVEIEAVGEKAELYREVMLRAHRAERETLDGVISGIAPTLEGATELADAYLDFYLAHPEYRALWQHRWMGDAADVPGLEELYTRPLSGRVVSAVRGLVPPDIDPDHLIWTVVWCVYGFLSGGMQHMSGRGAQGRGQALDPEAVAAFRAHLHAMVRRLTAPL